MDCECMFSLLHVAAAAPADRVAVRRRLLECKLQELAVPCSQISESMDMELRLLDETSLRCWHRKKNTVRGEKEDAENNLTYSFPYWK